MLINEAQHKTDFLKPNLNHGETRKRVLIVEDDLTYKAMWEHILMQIDPAIKVDWTQSEEQAEKFINKRIQTNHPYDLIISDVFLSGRKTGVDLWEKYGDWSSHFMFVSSVSHETFENLMSQGYAAPLYMQKPLIAKECRQLLQELIGRDPSNEEDSLLTQPA